MISLGGGDTRALTYCCLQLLPDTPDSIDEHRQCAEDTICVPGVVSVAASENSGKAEQELQILFDPHRTADLG